MRTNILRAGLLAFVAVGLVACSEPPEQAMQSVSTAADAAKAAGAESYAGEALQQAQDLMNRADAEKAVQDEKFVLFRSYKDSEALYTEAQASFESATVAAAAGKEKAKGEATVAIEGAKAALAAAGDALSKAPKSKDSRADMDLWANDLTTYGATVAEAETAFAAEDYLGAKSQADSVTAKSTEISTAIQTAMDKVKARRR